MYEKWLSRVLRRGATYADLRLQRIATHGLELRNGRIERNVGGREEGVGVRVLAHGAWGFAAANDVRMPALEAALERALSLAKAVAARTRDRSGVAPATPHVATVEWRPRIAPDDVDPKDQEEVVHRMHEAVKGFPQVRSTSGSYGDRTVEQEFYSSEGARVHTRVTRTVAQVHFVAKERGRITSRRVRVGATRGFEVLKETDVAAKAREAARATVRLLRARAAKGGRTTVVLDPELAGVFAHEALGHASEGDLVASEESCLRGRIGERLAEPFVTLVDDATVEGGFGSFPFDDEGQPARRRVLLEGGVVKRHLHDRVSAFKLGQEGTASARAESYAARPLVRMTNTFITAGDRSFEELIEGIRDGVYAVGSRGGQVDTAKGSFQFNAQESYRIRNGRIAEPLRDVSLTGFTLETLAAIEGLGREFAWGDPGYCGKGQYVPVGDGGPHVRVGRCVVGGVA